MLQSKADWKFINNENDTIVWEDHTVNLSPVLQNLLRQRGITDANEAENFLQPKLNHLHDPALMFSINKAKERVEQAIRNEEKILVYGDYDADGISSTALLINALEELGAQCEYYIPNRFTEGYGPNEDAFRQAKNNGFNLIITVDTGIAAIHEAEVAKQIGLDLIITDHHEPQDELPNAYAIIHPKCSPDYPFKDLAGVGVAFKFAQFLLGYFPEHLLDLTCIGTIADLVPLKDENRILAYHGLKKLSSTDREGLQALKTVCQLKGEVTEEDVGFMIGPRLNAVGRLQDADIAVRLLITKDKEEAESLAMMIDELNLERQQIVATIVEEAEQLVDREDKQSVIVVAKTGWHEGVLGIVASRLVKKYDRPAIVLSIDEEKSVAKGSARSIPAFNLFKNCLEIKQIFTHFGGHSQAAGMKLPSENITKLQDQLNQLIKSQLTIDDFKQTIEVSYTVSITDINERLIDDINKMAPFGMGNPKPIFHIKSIPVEFRQIGHLNNHLKIQFKDEETNLDGIGFGMGSVYHHLTPKTPLSIVGELGINEWNGFKKTQIIMHDLKIDEWQLFDHRGKEFNIFPYLENDEHHLVLANNTDSYQLPEQVNTITYHSELTKISKVESIYVYDLPPNLNQLRSIIEKARPANIHVCFSVRNSAYMAAIPTREDFKWYYAFIWKKRKLDINKQINAIMAAKRWSKNKIIFMSKVFFELEFVSIDNGVIELNPSPIKRDLKDSVTYQQQMNKALIEKTLYYSTYEDLCNWFAQCMPAMDMSKEEATYGF